MPKPHFEWKEDLYFLMANFHSFLASISWSPHVVSCFSATEISCMRKLWVASLFKIPVFGLSWLSLLLLPYLRPQLSPLSLLTFLGSLILARKSKPHPTSLPPEHIFPYRPTLTIMKCNLFVSISTILPSPPQISLQHDQICPRN